MVVVMTSKMVALTDWRIVICAKKSPQQYCGECGAYQTRTDHLLHAMQALYQMS